MHQSCEEKKKEQVTDWGSVKEKEANRILDLVLSSSQVCPPFKKNHSINVFVKAGHLRRRRFAACHEATMTWWRCRAAGSLTCLRCFSPVWPLGGSTAPASRLFDQIVKSLMGFVRYSSEEKKHPCNKKKLKKCLQEKWNSRQVQLWFIIFFVSPSAQGEDGFPGFKGDMGIKGDRVWVCEKNRKGKKI